MAKVESWAGVNFTALVTDFPNLITDWITDTTPYIPVMKAISVTVVDFPINLTRSVSVTPLLNLEEDKRATSICPVLFIIISSLLFSLS